MKVGRPSITDAEGKRRCTMCKERKDEAAFGWRSVRGTRYRMSVCKSCNRQRYQDLKLRKKLLMKLAE